MKTHGLILDEKGEKMSKSMWNYIDPQDLIEGTVKLDGSWKYGYGAEVFWLWAAKNDTDKDIYVEE